ncbi:MAG: sodium:proton antiporter [Alphaproteobacteria bacterium]|nr:MAG: sodium:proton antiporter [Alphaproteobacteria bacterium]
MLSPAMIPFIGFFTSLLWMPKKYENHNCIFWGILGLLCLPNAHSLTEMLWGTYTPFITLLTSLYIVANHLKLKIEANDTSLTLTLFLLFGGLLANILGTTGASVLLIYPLINLIKYRKQKAHIILFFIFIVCNCGGCLTPLGDPPLLVGYLKGVKFFWPLQNLWKAYAFMMVALLGLFFCIDAFVSSSRGAQRRGDPVAIKLTGLPYLGALALTVGLSFTEFHLAQLALCAFLIYLSKKDLNWHPIEEVAKIFLVIFIVLIPFEQSFKITTQPTLFQTFWMCGLLSSILDNTPTYLLFFNLFSGNPTTLMTTLSPFLKAISMSAVCMGALTYIGNAPNLMIRAIATDLGIEMPSFLGYTRYAFLVLGPVFLVLSIWFL